MDRQHPAAPDAPVARGPGMEEVPGAIAQYGRRPATWPERLTPIRGPTVVVAPDAAD
jgi:hypothetical protein